MQNFHKYEAFARQLDEPETSRLTVEPTYSFRAKSTSDPSWATGTTSKLS